MALAVECHDALVRASVEGHRGRVVKTTGDGIYAAFLDAVDAVEAVIAFQIALADPAATADLSIRVRVGLHAGPVVERDHDYFGTTINRTARIMGVAHGEQVLLSQAVVGLVQNRLPLEVSLRDLGNVRLRDLTSPAHVYQLLHPQLRQEFPVLRSLEVTPNNLPQQVTSFIGREDELAKLHELVSATRLVTVVGVGGIGKTRLSLQVGAEAMDEYPDGVWFVELAGLALPQLVPSAVAQALGVREEPGASLTETLCAHMHTRQLLMVLDNCEHLLDACAKLASALLRASPDLRVIATSREPLHVDGEQRYLLPPMSLPDLGDAVSGMARSDAVKLFFERVRLQQPDFAMTEKWGRTAAAVCARLDGIPLAIELAAARTGVMTLETIAERLDDRFRLLNGGSRAALPRQQTLRAMIDWSYDLLSDHERVLLRRLASFAGGCTSDAAETVCGYDELARDDVLELMTHLVQKSLVVFDDTNGRYRLLETIRQYARDRLQESGVAAATHERHQNYFVEFVENSESALLAAGSQQEVCLDLLALEHDNVRAILARSLNDANSKDAAARVCGAIYRFWMYRGHLREGRDWCERASSQTGAALYASYAKALLGAGSLAFRLGDLAAANEFCTQALAACREFPDRSLEARVLNNLGIIASDRDDPPSARTFLDMAASAAREVGNPSLEAIALANQGRLALNAADLVPARSALERALAICRDTSDRMLQMHVLSYLAPLEIAEGNLATATTLNQQALEMSVAMDNSLMGAEQTRLRGRILLALGAIAPARDEFGKALRYSHECGSRFSVAECFDELTILAIAMDSFDVAATYWGAADALREAIATPRFLIDRERCSLAIAECRATLGDARFNSIYERGKSTPIDTTVAAALGWLSTTEASVPSSLPGSSPR